jgi:anhydro-N-acetylmuramic acid kinase
MDKDRYIALGLMSGTSLDGVDVAIIETDGINIFGFGDAAESDFSKDDKTILQAATQDALNWGFAGPPPNSFALAEEVVDRVHVDAIGALTADIVGYHGQTILHHPPLNGQDGRTLQLGRGRTLADELGVPVVYDFRTADVAAGGQGAPLAPIYHEALCRYSGLSGRIAVLNIGGVSNVSLIEDGQLQWATDCGPGNGPLDSWILSNSAESFDRDGLLSLKGSVDHALVKQWLEQSFFARPIPRSADRYDFDVLDDLQGYSLEDGAATLAAFCAQSIAAVLEAGHVDQVVVCGGGRRNPAIIAMLDIHTDSEVIRAEDVGWDGDMLEAQAFAYLAVRSVKNLPISFPSTTGAPAPKMGGQIIYPKT